MGIQIKRFIGVLAAVAAIGIGSAVPANASVAAGSRQETPAAGYSPAGVHLDGVLRSKSVNISADGGQFVGTLEYYSSLVGKNYELYFIVSGKLYVHKKGTSYLYANFQCSNGGSPQAPKIGQTTGTESIGYESPECSTGIINMRVELSFVGTNSGGTTFSGYL